MKKICAALLGVLLAAGMPLFASAQASQPTLEDYWRESWKERITYHTQRVSDYEKKLAEPTLDDESAEFLTYEIEYAQWAIEQYKEKMERLH